MVFVNTSVAPASHSMNKLQISFRLAGTAVLRT